MATQDAAGRPESPDAARCWRLVASEPALEVWDLAFADVAAAGARVVGHLASGDAGPGYEVEQAFRDGPGWWGGRAADDPDGERRCSIGVEFDRPVVPTSITIAHADGRHRARRVLVQSSPDGREWTTHDEVDVVGDEPGSGRAATVFYAPPEVPAAPTWRLVARMGPDDFAWDVQRIRFLRRGVEVAGELTSSGDAGVGFGPDQARIDDGAPWGGRADDEGRFHLTLSASPDGPDEIEVDRIVLVQGARHWAPSAVLERPDANGDWEVWRHLGALRPGHNDVLLASQPRRASRVADRPAEPRTLDRFGDRRILVLIAAYRDPELPSTVAHALAQAAYPEHVRFAICHQYDADTREQLAPWADDPRVRIDAVHHSESHGCGWARHRTFEMYDDEPYVLQIDAHMRFAARWDVRYVEMLESTGVDLPILSSYPPRYTLDDDGAVEYDLTSGAQRLYVDEVHDDLTTRQKTALLVDPSRPEPSPVLAAGQLFTRGRFCRDVPYDPQIYFGGEEISLSARAYTTGYDVFAPTQNLVWHLYQHAHPKHWDDHADHGDRHRVTAERLHTLFRGDDGELGEYGLGSVRSLAAFEDQAGIRLGARRVAPDGAVTIRIDRSVIAPRDDYRAFVVVLLDADGAEVDRREVRAPDVLDLSRAEVRLRGVTGSASQFVVLPVTAGGHVGEIAVRTIPADGVDGAAT